MQRKSKSKKKENNDKKAKCIEKVAVKKTKNSKQEYGWKLTKN